MVTNSWIHMEGSKNGFRLHEFVEGPGAGELELVLSERRFQLTRIVSRYAWAVSVSSLLQPASQVEIGAAPGVGCGGVG